MQPEGVIVAVSGGRDYENRDFLYRVLDEVHEEHHIGLLIHGQCPEGGADELARQWAIDREVNCLSVPPKVKRYGWPSAGPLRNTEMGKMRPVLWVLFPGGKGTESARQVARLRGIKVKEVRSDA